MIKKYFKIILIILFTFGCYTYFQPKSEITIVGPVQIADGLGKNTVEFLDLLATKYRVNCYSTHKVSAELPKHLNKLFIKKSKDVANILLYTQPMWQLSKKDVSFLKFCRSKKDSIMIAYSMFESSELPKEGVKHLNEFFDLIVVPDEQLVEVYKNSGITKPIQVLELAVDFDSLEKFPIKKARQEKFVFAIAGSAIYRKNILDTVKAFEKIFANRSDVELRINSRYSANGSNHEILRYLAQNKLKNVKYTTKALSKQEYDNFLASSDCLLSVSMGEGFSIQPREAMILGIPTIVTNNMAQKTICATNLVRAVRSDIIEPAYHYFSDTPFGNYYRCTIDDLSDAMLDVYENYQDYLSNAEKARKWAFLYSTKHLKEKYIQFFDPQRLRLLQSNTAP
jgi:glycosyltransferase involved in cell wall biosynthesis